MYGLVEQYYDSYETDHITKDELLNFYELKHPKAKDQTLIVDLIHSAFAIDLNEELVRDMLDQLLEKHQATKIINTLLPVMEGEKYGVLPGIKEQVESYLDLLHNPPEALTVPEPCMMDLPALVEQEVMDEGLAWHIPRLTEIIGGVRSKTLGLIYAFVDSGKTSFALASMAAHANALSPEEIICYCGNEESAPRLRLRAVQAFTNFTRGQIAANLEQAQEVAFGKGFGQIRIFDNIITGDQIQYVMKEYKPTIVYIDQATDVDVVTKRKEEGVGYLKILFKWYRRLASQHDTAVIGVAQGVGDSENTKYLKLSDIYGSRVAIQGALDYGIGIGRTVNDPVTENLRYIHVPKNKLYDGEGGRFATEFIKQTCSWRIV